MNSALFHQQTPPPFLSPSQPRPPCCSPYYSALLFYPWPPLALPLSPVLFHVRLSLCPCHKTWDYSLYMHQVKYARNHLFWLKARKSCMSLLCCNIIKKIYHKSKNTVHMWERLASSRSVSLTLSIFVVFSKLSSTLKSWNNGNLFFFFFWLSNNKCKHRRQHLGEIWSWLINTTD